MASAGGDNDENHWPGYVDALTTMTMMLIFVMMILSVAMFSMSESVSRGLIEKIAAAAGVAVNSEGLSTGDYAEQVVNKLGDRSPGQADGRGLLSDGGGQGVGGAAAPAIKPTTGYAGAPGEERRIESGVEAPPVPPTPGVRIDRASMHLTLVYKPRSTGLDTDSEAAIKTFVEDIARASPEAIFSIHAYASPTNGALSDSRRVAYYRAMTARTRLLAQGVPAPRISIHVEDRQGAEEAEQLRIYVKQPG